MTVTGARAGDYCDVSVMVGSAAAPGGTWVITGQVTANDTVTVSVANPVALTLTNVTVKVRVTRWA